MIASTAVLEKEITCGFVALLGPPNAGKSTLLNRILGQKIAIVSPKPQTTQSRILGILNNPEEQIVFLDTPGLHRSQKPLNLEMMKIANESAGGADIIAYLLDASDSGQAESEQVKKTAVSMLKQAGCPAILLCNKIDRIDKNKLLPIISSWSDLYHFAAIVPVSALNGEGCSTMLEEIRKLLPKGYRMYPPEMITDLSERFICAEIIREKIMLLTRDEMPYSASVFIEDFREEKERMTSIYASIMVGKNSQKAILIGSKGEMLKRIGQSARKDIEKLLGTKVLLKLWVKKHKGRGGKPGVPSGL